jgi:hypothetical protein
MMVLTLDCYFPLLAANSALSPLNRSLFSTAILRGLSFLSAQITRWPKSLGYLSMGSSHTHNPSHSTPFLPSSRDSWVLAAAAADVVAAVTGERWGCNTGQGSQKCGGSELRHRLVLLQWLQRAAASGELVGEQAAAPAAVATMTMSQA